MLNRKPRGKNQSHLRIVYYKYLKKTAKLKMESKKL